VSTYPHRQVNGNTFVSLALRDGTALIMMISVAKLSCTDYSPESKCSASTILIRSVSTDINNEREF
jgi:hypothetical protein